jgi:isopentenyldiphosphate isomerase
MRAMWVRRAAPNAPEPDPVSFLDRIRECNTRDLSRFRPFTVAGRQVGWVKRPFLDELAAFPELFDIREEAVVLSADLETPEARTRAVEAALRKLADRGVIEGWRDEAYPVTVGWGVPPLMLIERAAAPHLGVRAYGVHMNGFVRDGERLSMWVARRAYDKPTFPGMLDNMVAGGQPHGISLADNLVKECAEEADIPEALARRAVPVGAVTYAMETPEGLKPDVQFVYELEVPHDFTPRAADGEIHEFMLWPIERVMETVSETAEFKFNCNLVIIHFLVQHGLIPPDHPDYLEIVKGLHQ